MEGKPRSRGKRVCPSQEHIPPSLHSCWLQTEVWSETCYRAEQRRAESPPGPAHPPLPAKPRVTARIKGGIKPSKQRRVRTAPPSDRKAVPSGLGAVSRHAAERCSQLSHSAGRSPFALCIAEGRASQRNRPGFGHRVITGARGEAKHAGNTHLI